MARCESWTIVGQEVNLLFRDFFFRQFNPVYQALTELTLIVHLLFILFVIAGGFFARRRRWLTTIHLSAVAWAIYVELAPGIICPLTSLENNFASHAGLATYQEDFVARYLVPVIYPEELNPAVQYLLVGLVVALNLVAYAPKRKRTLGNN